MLDNLSVNVIKYPCYFWKGQFAAILISEYLTIEILIRRLYVRNWELSRLCKKLDHKCQWYSTGFYLVYVPKESFMEQPHSPRTVNATLRTAVYDKRSGYY